MPLSPDIVEGPLAGRALDQATDVAVRAFDDDPFFSYLFPKSRPAASLPSGGCTAR